MMACSVSVIYNNDAINWTQYLQEQLSKAETVNARVFLQRDDVLFAASVDRHSETHVLKSSVVIVLVTPGHMDYMISNTNASYEKYVPSGRNGVMFLLGVTEENINESRMRETTRRIFPNYGAWLKVTYKGENSINELLDTVLEMKERPQPIDSKFTVIPTTVHCEEETTVVALIDRALPEEAVVSAVVRGIYLDKELPCEQVNSLVYRFVMPKNAEDKVTVSIKVDKQFLSSGAEISYVSYIAAHETAAVSEIYCHLLDILCTFIKNIPGISNAATEIDKNLIDIFGHMIDLPAVGYEKLFGIYQYVTEDHSHSVVPTLVHLGVRHNLKELLANLQDLPCFTRALRTTNKEGREPKDIAHDMGFTDIYKFIQYHEEAVELYTDMIYGDKPYYMKRYQNTSQNRASVESINYEYPDTVLSSDDTYIDMGGTLKGSNDGHSSPDTVQRTSSHESYLAELTEIQEKLKSDKLSMDDFDREFINWQKKHVTVPGTSFRSKQAELQKLQSTVNAKSLSESIQGRSFPNQLQKPDQQQLKSSSGYAKVPPDRNQSTPPKIPERMPYPKATSQNVPPSQAWTRQARIELTPGTGASLPMVIDKMRRNSDRSSGASTESRISNVSAFSERGSISSCSSGIEEDLDSRVQRRKSIRDMKFPKPPKLPTHQLSAEPVEDSDAPQEQPPPIPVFSQKPGTFPAYNPPSVAGQTPSPSPRKPSIQTGARDASRTVHKPSVIPKKHSKPK